MTEFDNLLIKVAKQVFLNSEIDTLGRELGFTPTDVQRHIATNLKTQNVTWDGTLNMLRDWRKSQEIATEREGLKTALKKAGQIRLADELFPLSYSVSQTEIHDRDVKAKRRKVEIPSPSVKEDDQKQRDRDDTGDDMRKQVDENMDHDEKRAMLEKIKQPRKIVESKLTDLSNSSSKHLDTIKGDIQETLEDIKGNFNDIKRKKNKLIRDIDKEADKEIRAIKERRQKQIEAYKGEIAREQKISEDKQAKLLPCLSDTDKISEIVSDKIMDLTGKIPDAIKDNQHDETLVNEAPQVLASIDENLSLNVHQDVSNCLDRIKSEVERVKFVEGEVGGEYYGRVDGYIGKWEIAKSIHISSVVNRPRVLDLVSDEEICVQDVRNKDMYITNINTQHTEKVIDGGVSITSCAPIDSNVKVCGKVRDYRTEDRSDVFITLYDRQWKVIRDISIPRDGKGNNVYVGVDRDGMILAAQYNRSNIYVINPADDKIVNAITMQGKEVMGGIQALSSGDIVVKTDNDKYTVISRSGEEKAVMHCDEWDWSECRVDKLTDTLYIAYRDGDEASNTYAVDQVSRDGFIQAKKIMKYVKSDRSDWVSPCLVTPSGNLVGCDGDQLLVYKKVFMGYRESLQGMDMAEIGGSSVSSAKAHQKEVHTLESREDSGDIPEMIRITKYGIEVQIPPNKAYSAKDITVEVIDEVPPELKIKETEAIITYGLKMKAPSNAIFEHPVQVTMPHSAVFKQPKNAEIISYCRKSASADFVAIPSTKDISPRCVVRKGDLDIYFHHFCEYWFVAVRAVYDLYNKFKGIFIGKRLVCTPYVPIPPFLSKIHILFVHIRDAHKEEGEVPTGYKAPFKGDEFLFEWGSGPLMISCPDSTMADSPTILEERKIRYLTDLNPKFKVDTTNIPDAEMIVTFLLKQSTTSELPVKMQLIETPSTSTRYRDSRTDSSSSTPDLDILQAEQWNTAPVSVGAQPRVDLSAGATKIPSQVDMPRHKLTDAILLELANQINSTAYPVREFAVDLGFDEATAASAEQMATLTMDPQRGYTIILNKFVLVNGRGAQKLINIFTEKKKKLLVDVITEGMG
ncbi:uncharacterized protein LOC135154580 [Lytechinus pictus]|uniref:uncharacterized protein LOC135154580 n=1 Tax=Lytechinus pictus TaxID=7653 RepID=UPI0030B9CDFF